MQPISRSSRSVRAGVPTSTSLTPQTNDDLSSSRTTATPRSNFHPDPPPSPYGPITGAVYLALESPANPDASFFTAPLHTPHDNVTTGERVGHAVVALSNTQVEIRIAEKIVQDSIYFNFQIRKVDLSQPESAADERGFVIQDSVFRHSDVAAGRTLREQVVGRRSNGAVDEETFVVYVLTHAGPDAVVTSRIPMEQVPFLQGGILDGATPF